MRFVFLAAFALLCVSCNASYDALSPSFLEAAAAASARLPHCTDIVDQYIKLEKATEANNNAIKRDWTCVRMANKLWTLLAGHTNTQATHNRVQKALLDQAVKLADSTHGSTTATLFNLNIVDCDSQNNKVCKCSAPATNCNNKWSLQASSFYIVEIFTKPSNQRTYKDALAHYLVVYVHQDGSTVSIYQASAGVTPLIRKTSTLAKFTQGLASLITLQTATSLTKPQSALLDQFALLDKKDPTGIKYLKEVLSVSVGGGFTDTNCQTMANNLATAKGTICELICSKAATKTVKKRTWLVLKVKTEVCDC